jgi:hypothetical protein
MSAAELLQLKEQVRTLSTQLDDSAVHRTNEIKDLTARMDRMGADVTEVAAPAPIALRMTNADNSLVRVGCRHLHAAWNALDVGDAGIPSGYVL